MPEVVATVLNGVAAANSLWETRFTVARGRAHGGDLAVIRRGVRLYDGASSTVMGRVILSLGTTDVKEMTKSFNVDNEQQGEPLLTEAEVLDMQRDEGWEEFPCLDT